MLQYLIVCPLVFLAGFVDSIAGGGGLISLPAYIIAGVPAHFAIGTNKLSSTLGTSISTWRYLKQGYLKGKQLILPVVCACFTALAGSYLGSSFSMMVSDTVLKHMMMVALPIVAFYVLRNKNMGAETEQQALPVRAMLCISMAVAFVIGMYDGFYGPGTGTFYLLILTRSHIRPLPEAAAWLPFRRNSLYSPDYAMLPFSYFFSLISNIHLTCFHGNSLLTFPRYLCKIYHKAKEFFIHTPRLKR